MTGTVVTTNNNNEATTLNTSATTTLWKKTVLQGCGNMESTVQAPKQQSTWSTAKRCVSVLSTCPSLPTTVWTTFWRHTITASLNTVLHTITASLNTVLHTITASLNTVLICFQCLFQCLATKKSMTTDSVERSVLSFVFLIFSLSEVYKEAKISFHSWFFCLHYMLITSSEKPQKMTSFSISAKKSIYIITKF